MKLPWYARKTPVVAYVAGLGGLVTVVNLACGQAWTNQTPPDWTNSFF